MQIYSAVSTVLRRQELGGGVAVERSIVDRAICSKPGEDLAGQLLRGISLHCSNFVLTGALPWRKRFDCGVVCGAVQHSICPAKSYHASNYPRSGFSTNAVAVTLSAIRKQSTWSYSRHVGHLVCRRRSSAVPTGSRANQLTFRNSLEQARSGGSGRQAP